MLITSIWRRTISETSKSSLPPRDRQSRSCVENMANFLSQQPAQQPCDLQVHKESTHGQPLDQDVDPKNTRDDNDDDEEWDKVVTDNIAGGEPSAKEIPPLVPEYVPANVVFPMKKSELYSYQKASWKLNPEAKKFIPTDPNLTFVYTSSGIVPLEMFDELRKPAESRSRLFFTKMQPYYRHWSSLTDEQQVELYLDAVQPKQQAAEEHSGASGR
ncbi:hypothetical protein BJ166DRAFT_120857 [Pestalotiopsis sp. NC0098]|nr:hypothetical protein BJ166DRAFT_120857 [Pestalotiopsis sp. NC0098]